MSVSGVKKHYLDHEKMLFTMIDYYMKNVDDEEKRKTIENRLTGVCNMQYSFYCLLPSGKKYKTDFIKFDDELKKYPFFYNRINGRLIEILRKYNFAFCGIIAKLKTNRDRKNKWNFFAE